MWNDRDIPVAYLITFRCYGTWLHGDERGSIDWHNKIFNSPYIEPNSEWKNHNKQKLKGDPYRLETIERNLVEDVIRETCVFRKWQLWAINVRTNNVHTVVSTGGKKPELALNAFKANATRTLREKGSWVARHSPWSDKGSCRRLWNEQSLSNAIEYVVSGQGVDLPRFE